MLELVKISRSPLQHKKYRADVLIDGKLHKNVDFGDLRYEHYRDTTPLKLYTRLDHNDGERRRRYIARHKHNNGPAGRLSMEFLWN